jgi:hypothetical protein
MGKLVEEGAHNALRAVLEHKTCTDDRLEFSLWALAELCICSPRKGRLVEDGVVKLLAGYLEGSGCCRGFRFADHPNAPRPLAPLSHHQEPGKRRTPPCWPGRCTRRAG